MISEGVFDYKDLLGPNDKEKLEAHVQLYPNDLISGIVLDIYKRIDALEFTTNNHVHHRLL